MKTDLHKCKACNSIKMHFNALRYLAILLLLVILTSSYNCMKKNSQYELSYKLHVKTHPTYNSSLSALCGLWLLRKHRICSNSPYNTSWAIWCFQFLWLTKHTVIVNKKYYCQGQWSAKIFVFFYYFFISICQPILFGLNGN